MKLQYTLAERAYFAAIAGAPLPTEAECSPIADPSEAIEDAIQTIEVCVRALESAEGDDGKPEYAIHRAAQNLREVWGIVLAAEKRARDEEGDEREAAE